MLVALVLVLAASFSAFQLQPAHAQGVCPAPGTGLAGAYNMIADPTMGSVPMAVDAAQGNAGMYTAVGNTSCP